MPASPKPPRFNFQGESTQGRARAPPFKAMVLDFSMADVEAAADVDPCMICLDTEIGPVRRTFKCGCQGTLHDACLAKWHEERKDVCPICRKCEHCDQIARVSQGETGAHRRRPLPGRRLEEEYNVDPQTRACVGCCMLTALFVGIAMMIFNAIYR